jgi:23S rRNA A1618 N6-methylase RlmF
VPIAFIHYRKFSVRLEFCTDTDVLAIENCSAIIEENPKLIDAISLQQQTEARFIFKI